MKHHTLRSNIGRISMATTKEHFLFDLENDSIRATVCIEDKTGSTGIFKSLVFGHFEHQFTDHTLFVNFWFY